MQYYSVAKVLYSIEEYEKAYKLFSKGAFAGDVKCNFGVALCYNDGLFVEKNTEKASKIMKENYPKIYDLANGGDRDAMVIVAYCFSNGFFTETNEKLSDEWHKKARQPWTYLDKRIDDYFLICRDVFENHSLNKTDICEINDLFEIATFGCMIGDTRCLYYLSECYENGYGTEKNIETSDSMKEFYYMQCKNLADAGDCYSMYVLYLCNWLGLGTYSDLEKAKDWIIKSANFGDDFSKYKIAYFSLDENDNLFENDGAIALKWLTQAAKNGNKFAIEKLKEIGEDDLSYNETDYFNIDCYDYDDSSFAPKTYNLNDIKSNTGEYINKLVEINDAIQWVYKYGKIKKYDCNTLMDCKGFHNEICSYKNASDFVKTFVGTKVNSYFEDYIKLDECLSMFPQFLDEIYKSCIVKIDYVKKSHVVGLIKVTKSRKTIKIEETPELMSMKKMFLSSLEENSYEEAKKLCNFLRSICADIKNLGQEDNLDTMLQFAKNYNKINSLAKMFYVAQYVFKYGNIINSTDDFPIMPDFSKKMSRKYPYFNAILGSCSKIYLVDINNLK